MERLSPAANFEREESGKFSDVVMVLLMIWLDQNMDKAKNYVTRVSRKSGVFVSCSGVFSVTWRSDSESKDFTMKNIDFTRKASLSVPVVGNHSVSEETPSPPKVGTYIKASNRYDV